MEFFRCYTNDGHRMTVKGDCFPNDAGITRETSLPVVVTQDNDGAESRRRSFRGQDEAAKVRFDVEGGEIIARDEVHIDGLGLSIDCEAARAEEIPDDVREYGSCLGLQIFQLGNRKTS